jgi:hypothetical protein
MSISEGAKIGVVGQEGFILIAISADGSEEVLLALTGEGAEKDIQSAVRAALANHDRLEVRIGVAPFDLTWN